MPIFSDALLNQLTIDAQQEIDKDLQCLFYRFGMATTIGTSVYLLPSMVRSVKRVVWLGYKLDAVTFQDMMLLSPATAGGFYDNTSNSRPLYYCMHPTNPYDIRFFPTPNISFSGNENPNPYAPTNNGCVISCWRSTDDTFQDPTALLPPYVYRRTVKAFVLWKAFAGEGIGQNLKAAEFYQQKYSFLIDSFRLINEGCFVSKRYSVEDGALAIESYRYPKPMLPPNFECIIFK